MDQEELEEQTADRRDNYAMLSRLYRSELDRELISELKDSPVPEPTGNASFDSGLGGMHAFLADVDDLDRAKSELAIDYCLAFLGYGVDPETADEVGRNAAYPYESTYTTTSKSLGGDHCADVTGAYRSFMFAPQKDRIVADDHIACELEFMAFLAASELQAMQDGEPGFAQDLRERELEFIEKHLLSWIDDFKKAVDHFAETRFYAGLLDMTKGWLEMDAQHLRDLGSNGQVI